MPHSNRRQNKVKRLLAIATIIVASVIVPLVDSLGQRRSKERPPKVTGISSRRTSSGTVISLAVDSKPGGTQTWQDPDGSFHLVLPGSGDSSVTGSPRGVNVRQIGNSLEIEVKVKRGSNVTVEPRPDGLDLVVEGDIEFSPSANDQNLTSAKTRRVRSEQQPIATTRQPRVAKEHTNAPPTQPKRQLALGQALPPSIPVEKSEPLTQTITPLPVQPGIVSAPTQALPAATPAEAASPEPGNAEEPGDEVSKESSFISDFILSGWWITILLVMVLVWLVIKRRRDTSGWEDIPAEPQPAQVPASTTQAEANAKSSNRRTETRRAYSRPGGRRSTDPSSLKPGSPAFVEPNEVTIAKRSAVNAFEPAMVYGAYRVDQEVGKLILGQPHRMDVLSSRGTDDRRAMETSLLKALRSHDVNERGRRKARKALEEYGFVARQSAAVLLAQDACERVAAARTLGEIGLSTSLQFLLEALYDSETIVRTQAVESIGLLRLPSAIGALLDMARRYPDVPSSILSNALNACSIESMNFADSQSGQPGLLLTGETNDLTAEIFQLEPSATFDNLPESVDDENFMDTMGTLQSAESDVRAIAAQTLAIYRVQSSVAALKRLASNDPEAAVRAVAVASLGAIDHESVFSSVLVALADEARDVRAAAARAVSRLSFDRADAYARVIETSDDQELTDVACACIKTGMAAQALDRLTSEDRRQAYEAYSLLSLLAKANQCQPILDVIESHADIQTCMVAIQLLGLSGQPELVSQLTTLAEKVGMPDQLREAIAEAISNLSQMQPA